MGQGMNCGRLTFTDNDDARAPVLLEILNQRTDPLSIEWIASSCSRIIEGAHLLREKAREALNLAAAQGQPMVSHCASYGWRAFDSIQTVHLVFTRGDSAAIDEFSRVTKAKGMCV